MSIAISYTEQQDDNTVYNIVIKNFTSEEIPRTYQGNFNIGQSANGASVMSGPAYRQKYIWAISAIVSKADALSIDAMFRDWDADRAVGESAAVGVADDTWGATVNSNAVFSTPPSFTYLNGSDTLVTFGLTEV